MFISLRRFLLGNPLPNAHAAHTRLPKRIALAVFSSDALSSTAYATEEILRALMLVGTAGVSALALAWPVALAIAALLIIVGLSYRLTIHAYPGGASAYLVAKDNLGTTPSLVAAASLLLDYLLTVAVSVSAGVAAIASAIPLFHGQEVPLALACIALITVANLRGTRESGIVFAIPTYGFLAAMVLLIGGGLVRFWGGVPVDTALTAQATADQLQHATPPLAALAPVTAFAVLRAFAAGCTALTGIEAISDGIPAFRRPSAANAATTLVWMIAILVILFLGLSYLATAMHLPALREGGPGYETVISQVAHRVFSGPAQPLYFATMAFSFAILIVAANTAYQDFPRLASLLARDRFLPRQLADLGDRLVFQNGILVLTVLAALLVIAFHASVSSLLPLYALGVFLSFTLSQTSMVLRWWRLRGPHWQLGLLVNSLGAAATAVVFVVIAVTKFNAGQPTRLHLGPVTVNVGAWLILVLITTLVTLFRKIATHYTAVGRWLQASEFPNLAETSPLRHTVLVLVPGLHRGVFPALEYSRSLSPDARAVYIELDSTATPTVKEEWERYAETMPLVILESPFRTLAEPLLEYIREVQNERSDDLITIVLPELDAARSEKWWHRLLHNSSAAAIRRALSREPGVVITSYPYLPEASPV